MKTASCITPIGHSPARKRSPLHDQAGPPHIAPNPGKREQPRLRLPRQNRRDPFGYESLSVTAPGAEETLWNIDGVLNVSLALSPALQPGTRCGCISTVHAQPATGTSFQLEEVYRGTHNLQAEILDAAGALMIRSAPTRFYVQQTSVLRQR